MNLNLLLGVLLLCLLEVIVAPPVDPKKEKVERKPDDPDPAHLNLEYGRYLQQVVEILEQDKDFAKKLENISEDAIKTGAVAHELEFVKHSVRNQLDELKRMELDRLRSLIRMQEDEQGVYRNEDERLSPPPGDGRQWRTVSIGDGFEKRRFRLPHHVDVQNEHTFEVEDLKKLIKAATKDLDEISAKRKEEFKRYEMEKEHQYRESLKTMSEAERKVAEAQHLELISKHKDHPAVHHPGSKQQLEQVWEEVDHLPKDEFDPKTFFRMHDINGDGYLDEEEVKALVALEVRKMYNVNNTEDDPVEMQEEFNRMEEHIFREADKNHDRLITMEEFLDMTRKPDFEQDDGWKGLDEQQIFSPEELMEYERQLAAQGGYPYQGGYPQGGHPQQGGYPQGGHPQGGYPQGGYPPQGSQYPPQGGHPQGGQYPPQQGYHPDQQYGYQPVQGSAPNNQGVQFQPLPPQGQQQQQGQHQGQGQAHPGQGQPQQYGVPQGQHPGGGGVPPHYPPQYSPPQYGGQVAQGQGGQVPQSAQPNQYQGVPSNSPQQAVPQQTSTGQAPAQPQAIPGGSVPQPAATGSPPK